MLGLPLRDRHVDPQHVLVVARLGQRELDRLDAVIVRRAELNMERIAMSGFGRAHEGGGRRPIGNDLDGPGSDRPPRPADLDLLVLIEDVIELLGLVVDLAEVLRRPVGQNFGPVAAAAHPGNELAADRHAEGLGLGLMGALADIARMKEDGRLAGIAGRRDPGIERDRRGRPERKARREPAHQPA